MLLLALEYCGNKWSPHPPVSIICLLTFIFGGFQAIKR